MQTRNQQGIKKIIIFFAAGIYTIAVAYGDIMFLQIVSKAFPGGFLGGLAYVGAIAAGGTALLLPLAKSFWFAPGEQHQVGWIFYIADLGIMGANALLAYQTSTGHVDPLLVTWQSYCPATPLLCALGWGLMFTLDPGHKLRHAQIGLQSVQVEQLAAAMERAANSSNISDIVNQAGLQSALYHAQVLSNLHLPLGTGDAQQQLQAPAQQPVVVPSTLTQTVPPPQAPSEAPGFFAGFMDWLHNFNKAPEPLPAAHVARGGGHYVPPAPQPAAQPPAKKAAYPEAVEARRKARQERLRSSNPVQEPSPDPSQARRNQ